MKVGSETSKRIGDLVIVTGHKTAGIVVNVSTVTLISGTQWNEYRVHWPNGSYGVYVDAQLEVVNESR